MTSRVTLPDRETRAALMRRHVEAVAESILTDHDGDAAFERYLRLRRHVHNYSPRNRILIHLQAPDSRLVASRTAFAAIAEEQGHEARSFKSRKGKSWNQHVMTRRGSTAIWIWGPPRPQVSSRTVTDLETGEDSVEERHYSRSFPVDVWAVEDIVYADTGEPLVAPDFVQPVNDPGLYDALVGFAASKGIRIDLEGLNGPRGVSKLGAIGLQTGDPQALRIAPLLHELGHELLHGLSDRLDDAAEGLHEAEAETVAAVVLNYLGHPIAMSASYLRHWEATPEVVLASMDRIARVAGEVVAFIGDREQEAHGGPREGPGGAATLSMDLRVPDGGRGRPEPFPAVV